MISFKVDKTFREGTYIIYRKGTYYFMWSEDDTQSPNYKVRYGTSKSPLGPIEIPENNIVIQGIPDQESMPRDIIRFYRFQTKTNGTSPITDSPIQPE